MVFIDVQGLEMGRGLFLVGINILPWDRHKYVVGLNRLMGSQYFPLDN
jgi:hypothetical protein